MALTRLGGISFFFAGGGGGAGGRGGAAANGGRTAPFWGWAFSGSAFSGSAFSGSGADGGSGVTLIHSATGVSLLSSEGRTRGRSSLSPHTHLSLSIVGNALADARPLHFTYVTTSYRI